jgi:hypothetical protein
MRWRDCRSAILHCSHAIESFTCNLLMAQERCPGSSLTDIQAAHLASISAAQHACSVPVQCHSLPVSVTHSIVICEASFSELASRTHLVRHNGMPARHQTSCIYCLCHGRLGRIQVSSVICHIVLQYSIVCLDSTTCSPHSASTSADWHAFSTQFSTQINFGHDISSYSLLESIIHQPFVEHFVFDDVPPRCNTRTSTAIDDHS